MMILVVTGIGTLIHIYAVAYMHDEPRGGVARFFCYLNLFCFFMLVLVLGSNVLVMFVGWEGVGLCSYLLIGYWYEKKSAADAGKKAFVMNRIGDWGFILGIFLLFWTFGTLDFAAIQRAAAAMPIEAGHFGVLSAIALLLFIGATGKSAQIPLFVWLPDAMEGPTPVSALIHAATMVTAGVYMVARSNWIFQLAPQAMGVVAVIGGLTALFAASIAIVQNDIKRVLAYSTVSQLGYMFLALGVGAFSAGVFHLMTHAFFKALLFLGSGSVIHAMHHEQDMRKMGALRKKIPITFATMAIGTLAIAGTPGLSGFFSKDEILWQAFSSPHGHILLWILGVAVAGTTAFYMFRMLFMTFYGESHVDHHTEHHIHESPRTMTIPLMVLAVGSIVAGWVGIPAWLGGSNIIERWLEPVFEPIPIAVAAVAARTREFSHGVEAGVAAVSVAIALVGFYIAFSTYYKKSDRADRVSAQFKGLYTALSNKWYVDEIYDALFVNRAKDLGTGLWKFDSTVVDGVVNGAASSTVQSALGSGWWDRWIVDGLVRFVGGFLRTFSSFLRLVQTGYAQNYALVMVLGVLILIGYVLWGN
jgi:NADH-quinone oxidoreductase subunit L